MRCLLLQLDRMDLDHHITRLLSNHCCALCFNVNYTNLLRNGILQMARSLILCFYCSKIMYVTHSSSLLTPLAKDPLILQSICFLMVSYLALCTYSALFKLKLFWFYRLLPHQQTDENSILFSAGLFLPQAITWFSHG